ncbi:unnamed protein product [Nyctereutes procyonoides]|uniref:(raccoon dog) hypothetical protein n=1 Tax=Nyctereutes procyonoides TaxID=34880 RepID=A0A811Y894_NYCPR|nr:unnamed protein product [Nyctereutes procyonoides]
MLLAAPLRTRTSPALLPPGAALDGGLRAAPPPLAAPAAAAAAAAPEARAAGAHALAGGPRGTAPTDAAELLRASPERRHPAPAPQPAGPARPVAGGRRPPAGEGTHGEGAPPIAGTLLGPALRPPRPRGTVPGWKILPQVSSVSRRLGEGIRPTWKCNEACGC